MKPQNKIESSISMYGNRQAGVVLFIALVALVVMSLAAAALIRSVDTSTMIAGNLATKQMATNAGDAGVETALNWLTAIVNLSTLDKDATAKGYYATQALNPTDIKWGDKDSAPAKDGTGLVNSGTDASGNSGTDASGNTVRYIIQRMCRNAGAPSGSNCLLGIPMELRDSFAIKEAPQAGAQATSQSPMYRITARVVGAKNTISYIQAFAY